MKKAILVVSHGTTFKDTRKKTIDAIESKIRNRFPEYETRRAYTGNLVINKLRKRDNIHIDSPEEALKALKDENYHEVIVQPLQIIPGIEYESIKDTVLLFKGQKAFKELTLGRPALYFQGGKNTPDDYGIFVDAIKEHIDKENNYVLMGHGTVHYANACYSCLQQVLGDKGFNNVYIGNVEGYPKLPIIIKRLMKDQINQVILKPLMLVSGHHARRDMIGQGEDGWQNQLYKHGIKVDPDMRSLGEINDFQEIFVKHVEDAISGRYEGLLS